jgi:glutamyl-Q tRNA(Asp) synthetase
LEHTPRPRYRGRFAPTPSGPLHLGSLLTAVASWLAARHAGGAWLLRIDDLDRARCPRGMDATILRQLEAHGLGWDEPPRYQSRALDDYRAALERLDRAGRLYACACTRAALKRDARAGPDGPVYAGTCRDAGHDARRHALRARLPDRELCVADALQGRQCRHLARDVGDFVVRRANGEFAYQLACAVDEHAQGITDVVRGADLLGSTFCQAWVQDELDLPVPRYAHLPVLVDARGRKLSKQNHAAPVEARSALANLRRCLALLNQPVPEAATPAELLAAAAIAWDAARVSRTAQLGDVLYNALQQTQPTDP